MENLEAHIAERLTRHLADNYLPRTEQIDNIESVNLFESGILDSASLVTVLSHLESEYAIMIPDEDLLPEHFSTIATTASYLARLLQQADGVGRRLEIHHAGE